jgi:formylglycine-generating enzyme required for sulfatase activity
MGSSEREIDQNRAICKAGKGDPTGAENIDPAGEDCPEDLFNNEYSPHEVYLADYWIDRTEVTLARYRQCVAAGRCSEPPYASGGERFDRPDFPVVLVTWQDAFNFCAWAGGRLPTEAEWERAAKGMTGRRYPWGQVYNPGLSNHGRNPTFGSFGGFVWSELDPSDGFVELAPVGSFPEGRTLDGIDDLAGNVEEWVGDYYAPEFARATVVNPRGPDIGDERVLKGGSYAHGQPILRGASRGRDIPSIRRPWRGFRCVQPL